MIVSSHSPRASIHQQGLFPLGENYDALPDRLLGEIDSWTSRRDVKMKIIWPADDSNTVEFFENLLKPSLQIKLEPFEDGRSRQAKSAEAKRKYTQLMGARALEATTASDLGCLY